MRRMTPGRTQALALLSLSLILVVSCFNAGRAHEVRPLITTLTAAGDLLSVEITLNLEAAIAGIGPQHSDTSESPVAGLYDRLRALPPAALEAEFRHFTPTFLELLRLESDSKRLPLQVAGVTVPGVGDLGAARISTLRLSAPLDAVGETLLWRVDERLGHSVVRLRDRDSGEIRVAEFVQAGETSSLLATGQPRRRGWLEVSLNYLETGFTHIVPHGLDHVLFVIGLFLLSTRFGALLWQVTAFTLAHTFTLALSMLDIVRLPPSIVEPLIAASIVYVAVENLATDRLNRWRPFVVFGFGLLHGLGFAGVLQEIGTAPGQFVLSLFAFNLGVELGQLAVIACCFLAVGWTMRKPWHRPAIVLPASLAIAVVAGFWFLERVGAA